MNKKDAAGGRKHLLQRVTAVETVCSCLSPVIAGHRKLFTVNYSWIESTLSVSVSFLRGWWYIWVHSWAVEHHSRHETVVTFESWRGKCLGWGGGSRIFLRDIPYRVFVSAEALKTCLDDCVIKKKKKNPPIDINKGRSNRPKGGRIDIWRLFSLQVCQLEVLCWE